MPAFPFTNFTAGLRKPALIPFGYFSPGDSISWIQGVPLVSGFVQSPLVGMIDGVNRVFTISGLFSAVLVVLRNGIVLDPSIAYTLAGSTVTFTSGSPFVPQPTDDLQVITV